MNHKYVWLTSTLLTLALILLAACSESPDSASPDQITLNPGEQVIPVSKTESLISDAKAWQGEAKGYLTSGNVEGDRIEVLVRLGKVLGAVEAYNEIGNLVSTNPPPPTATLTKMLAGAVNAEIVGLYQSIDPIIQQKEKIGITEVLQKLAQPGHMADWVNSDRAQEDKRRAAKNNIRLLKSRLESAVLALFASRHEFLLVSSSLNRYAGDMIAQAVSADGVVLDIGKLSRATAMMLATRDIDPRNVSYCDAQRIPMRAYKESVYELAAQKLWAQADGNKLSATATDVYQLAAEAQQAGERFPVKDTEKCS